MMCSFGYMWRGIPKLICTNPMHFGKTVGYGIGDLKLSKCLREKCNYLAREVKS